MAWLVHSWRGVLCCPQIHSTDTVCCPLLDTFPFNLALGFLGLGDTTYDDDKEEFQRHFPGQVCIFDHDDVAPTTAHDDIAHVDIVVVKDEESPPAALSTQAPTGSTNKFIQQDFIPQPTTTEC